MFINNGPHAEKHGEQIAKWKKESAMRKLSAMTRTQDCMNSILPRQMHSQRSAGSVDDGLAVYYPRSVYFRANGHRFPYQSMGSLDDKEYVMKGLKSMGSLPPMIDSIDSTPPPYGPERYVGNLACLQSTGGMSEEKITVPEKMGVETAKEMEVKIKDKETGKGLESRGYRPEIGERTMDKGTVEGAR